MIFVMNQDDVTIATLNNSSPEACPYWGDKHLENLNDSLSTYEFEVPMQHSVSELLVAENYVAISDMDGDLISFKIKNVAESFSMGMRTKKIFCENSAVSELNGHFVRPVTLTGTNADDAMFYVLNGSGWEKGTVDFLGSETVEFKDYVTGISGVQTIAAIFEGELKYRISRNRNGSIRKFVDLLEKRGEDTGKRFEYQKDIEGLTRTEDTTYLATALIGLGKADSNGKRMTFASVNNDLDWVGDEDARDRYGVNGRHIFGIYEDDSAENPIALRENTKKALKTRSKPSLTYDVSVILLETLADWSHEAVRLGDTVRVLDLTFIPEVVLSARIVSLERSYVDPTQDRAILGEYKPITLSIPAAVKQMQKQLVSNQGLLEGREKTIHVYPTPPEDLDRKWMDTSVTPNVLKRWDGVDWVPAGGEQGPEGPQGPQGESLYTWIKYATDGQGNGMSDDPTGKSYIGIAYNKTVPEESTNPSLYTWTLLKGVDGEQGIPGPAGVDGRTPYVHIAYANNDTGTLDFSTTIATNKTHMGTYSDYLPDDSLDPSDYTWAQIKGEVGQQGPQGISSYLYVRYSANANGNPMTAQPDSNSRYIGIVTSTSTSAPGAYSDYTWSRYQGPQGVQGLQGLQGPKGDQGVKGTPGENGVSSYTHIAYATGTTGQNFSTSHFQTATYIGIYVDFEPTDSGNYADYAWTLIKGADGSQGLPGPKGADGLTPYFHTAWATNSTGTTGFSTTVSLGKTYIGTYTDYISADSTDPSKYNWVYIKGEQGIQGIQGIQGPAGPNGESLYTWIKYADTPTSGMTDLPSGKTYIGIAYNKTTPTESSTYSDYTWSLIKGDKGAPGPAGDDGQSLYTWIKYADTPTTGMSDSPVGKKYMGIAYNKTVITESTNYADYSWSLIEGPQGAKGDPGIQGPPGANGTSQYVHIRYSAASNGNPMTTTPQSNTAYIGIANTTSSTAPTGYASYTWSLFKGPTGSQGVPGSPGANGTTTYTWVKYADTDTGSGMTDTPSGKRYIGLAFNKTTPTESNTASDYLWSPLYDNVQVGGRNLIRNTKDLTGYLYRTDDSYNGFNIARSVRGATGYIDTFSAASILPPEGTTHVLSFYAKASAATDVVCHWYSPNTTKSAVSSTGQRSTSPDGNIQVSITTSWQRYWVVWTQTATTSVKSLIVGRHSIAPAGTVLEIAGVQLEAGNVSTDWTPAPEDVDSIINDKVNQGDLDNLGKIVADISSEVNFKAGASEFEAMELAFNERVAQDILDKQQLAQDLATIEGRAILAETIAGESKLVTAFIETVITESEEGIFISNKGASTGILISNDRISFVDGTTEVAYISNQTMQINHGIFVESATIAKYKFELIPGTEILAIQWVGG